LFFVFNVIVGIFRPERFAAVVLAHVLNNITIFIKQNGLCGQAFCTVNKFSIYIFYILLEVIASLFWCSEKTTGPGQETLRF